MLHLKQTLHNLYTTTSLTISQTMTGSQVTWSCSPKLSVSGESWKDAIKPDVAHEYSRVDGSDIYLKFVVATKNDFEEVTEAVEEYRKAGVNCPVYSMSFGGRSEEYNPNVKEVPSMYGARLAVPHQDLHIPISEMLGESK